MNGTCFLTLYTNARWVANACCRSEVLWQHPSKCRSTRKATGRSDCKLSCWETTYSHKEQIKRKNFTKPGAIITCTMSSKVSRMVKLAWVDRFPSTYASNSTSTRGFSPTSLTDRQRVVSLRQRRVPRSDALDELGDGLRSKTKQKCLSTIPLSWSIDHKLRWFEIASTERQRWVTAFWGRGKLCKAYHSK